MGNLVSILKSSGKFFLGGAVAVPSILGALLGPIYTLDYMKDQHCGEYENADDFANGDFFCIQDNASLVAGYRGDFLTISYLSKPVSGFDFSVKYSDKWGYGDLVSSL